MSLAWRGQQCKSRRKQNPSTMSAFKNCCIRSISLYRAHAVETPIVNAFKEEWNMVKGNMASKYDSQDEKAFRPD